jgi:hypothetical protein
MENFFSFETRGVMHGLGDHHVGAHLPDRRYYVPTSNLANAVGNRGRRYWNAETGRFEEITSPGDNFRDHEQHHQQPEDSITDNNKDLSYFDQLPHPPKRDEGDSDRKFVNSDRGTHTSVNDNRQQQSGVPGIMNKPTKADLDAYLDEFHRLLTEHEEQVRRQEQFAQANNKKRFRNQNVDKG